MDLLKVSDFCRKFGLPHYRFSRYQDDFETARVEGYLKPWVIVNEHNQQMVAKILAHTGTKPKKERLSYEAYKQKYRFNADHFQKVWHRLQIEEQNGQMLIVDSKLNYRLLKQSRGF